MDFQAFVQLFSCMANIVFIPAEESDEFYEWLMYKMAQKYEDEHGVDKRINWAALK